MRELEPGPGKGIRELVWMLKEATRDLLVLRVQAQREVGGEHGRRTSLRWIERIRNRVGAGIALGLPLVRAGRALGQLPFVAEQVPEEVAAPCGRRLRPDDF